MRRSLKREYEYKNRYDFEECDTQKGRYYCKKRGHRKVRCQAKIEINFFDEEAV